MLINNINSEENNFDFTIIGTGPASLTLAFELEKKGFSSMLFEAGGADYSNESQKYYSGSVTGDKYFPLDESRLRYFGGTSGHWAGWCAPLDKYDLIDWPINYNDLEKYLSEASKILEIGEDFTKKPINENFNQNTIQFSSPINFKEKYYEKVIKSKKIGLCLNSPLLKIIGDEKGNADKIEIFNNNNKKIFKAKTLILGCGGIENSRILLWSQINSNTKFLKNIKIGNFWMEHPQEEVGYFVGSSKKAIDHFDEKMSADLAVPTMFFSPSYNFIKKQQIGNTLIKFQYLMDQSYVEGLIKKLSCAAPKFIKQLLIEQRYCIYKIIMTWEQKPEYENRIELSKNKNDDLGIPKVSLFWKKNEKVRRTARVAIEEFGKIIAEKNIGRVGIDEYLYDNNASYPEDGLIGGNHHMGGTRIGLDPNNYDVVDKNLKLFNTNNLYIIGSSIFRIAGHANPTLTIVQLSLRLADHLSSL